MYNQSNKNTDCLALAIRKEHRLVVVNKVIHQTISISWKAVLATIALTLVNMFV
ncbi:MAG TPA: hypothetical protein IAB70_03220 [Candidatus Merdicola faecigallinarum]|uniref:Uncharacterized protein n=1 Tax=Candidatus Merdicola faecigallinarum TaxID=2840862 RepID=A0A9D1M0V0_9FIRM|nr:hypothetical protein [Candidatus Merdicola faecigallinarum]